MFNLNYRLTEDDAVRYYQMISANSRETRIARIFAVIWVPAFLAALLIALKLYNSVLWIMTAVFLSLFWATFLAPRMFQDVAVTAARRKIEKDRFEYRNLNIRLKDDVLTVNGEVKNPVTFVAYYDLMVIAFDDNSNLIIPQHAFGGNEETMEVLVRYLLRSTQQ